MRYMFEEDPADEIPDDDPPTSDDEYGLLLLSSPAFSLRAFNLSRKAEGVLPSLPPTPLFSERMCPPPPPPESISDEEEEGRADDDDVVVVTVVGSMEARPLSMYLRK